MDNSPRYTPTNTVVTIHQVERINNSASGNPRWRLTVEPEHGFSESITIDTYQDAQFAFNDLSKLVGLKVTLQVLQDQVVNVKPCTSGAVEDIRTAKNVFDEQMTLYLQQASPMTTLFQTTASIQTSASTHTTERFFTP